MKKAVLKVSQGKQMCWALYKVYRPLLERDSNTGVFLRICEIFKNTYFEKHMQSAAFA